ncbi:MAG: hypothetical protein R6W95_10195 [Desulfosarcina sp.]|jgi:hypothetical protein
MIDHLSRSHGLDRSPEDAVSFCQQQPSGVSSIAKLQAMATTSVHSCNHTSQDIFPEKPIKLKYTVIIDTNKNRGNNQHWHAH